ncbi:hypothetical protein [Brachyspira hyodysenteriae]|uniref:hypothetical protein n=1 Tax=Brachyspira hyodysenteriae TaxID=159 RepID=UPI00063DD02A|nr:hypothetical protein [Brachyspira hyodysenteriae]KLI25928.1 hypothetical protein SU43_03250 [Brachyspira hyodysenteriae]
MTMTIKDKNLLDAYKIYFNHDNLNDFSNVKRNYILSSLIKEVKTINSKKESITDKEIETIYDILIKLSIMARIDLIMSMKSIKNKDTSFISGIKRSRDVIDYALKVIIKLLYKLDEQQIISCYSNKFIDNDSISHTSRVFIIAVRFMKYYNNSINNNVVSNIKKKFKNRYAKYYKNVLRKFNISKKITRLEHVYKSGLRDILFNELVNIAIAAFWHDISNLFNNYNKDYNTSKCYSYLKHFIRYNYDISLTVGLHNEYYGYGSGVFLNYYNTIINSNTLFAPNYIVSFYYNDTLRLNSVSYFPSKVLEIIDLFDRITYSDNPLNDEDALSFISDNYLEKEVKVDPIIFDIFSSFVSDNMKLIA